MEHTSFIYGPGLAIHITLQECRDLLVLFYLFITTRKASQSWKKRSLSQNLPHVAEVHVKVFF